jgi:FKBP-type peptidyl-prolyl cis-trans isomerase SlyD
MQFRSQSPQGSTVVTITKLEGDNVTVDANHPLAGLALSFDVDVKDIRQATKEELEHGHVHGPGGHHHH